MNQAIRLAVVAGCMVSMACAARGATHPAGGGAVPAGTEDRAPADRGNALTALPKMLPAGPKNPPILSGLCVRAPQSCVKVTATRPVGGILCLPASPPPRSPARGPPQHDLGCDADHSLDLDLDQTPAFDPTEPEPVPDFDFDPSRGD